MHQSDKFNGPAHGLGSVGRLDESGVIVGEKPRILSLAQPLSRDLCHKPRLDDIKIEGGDQSRMCPDIFSLNGCAAAASDARAASNIA